MLQTESVSPSVDYLPLAKVLEDVIDEDGLVDADKLRESGDALRRQLKILAVTGPQSSGELLPRKSERLAYWYNARAAWALELARLEETPKKLSANTLERRKFPLDGREMTLAGIDELLIEHFGWSAAAAAPGIRTTRAAIEQKPVTGDKDVREIIKIRLNNFIDDDKRFVIDIRHKQVLVPPIIWRFREQIIVGYNNRYGTRGANLLTALLPHTSGSAHRRLQDAIGYDIRRASRGKPAWRD